MVEIPWLHTIPLEGVSPKRGATVENRLDSAEAVNQTGNDIINQLMDPQIAAMLGPALGRYNNLKEFIGNPPPEFAGLAGQIHSYALANMGVHGMRSAQGALILEKPLDRTHTAESIIAAINGINGFSRHYMQNQGIDPGERSGVVPSVRRYNPATGELE
jgi:hypothetical protein